MHNDCKKILSMILIQPLFVLFVYAVANHHIKTFAISGECEQQQNQFEKIYENGIWGTKLTKDPRYYYTYGNVSKLSRQSPSGGGSVIGPETAASLLFLSSIINDYQITSILDIPCGDTNWQFQSFEMDSLEVYVGADIAPEIIALNKRKFFFHSNKVFALWDFTECEIPHYKFLDNRKIIAESYRSFDLIHVRDVLQHLPLKKGMRAINNIFKSGAKFLLATTFPKGVNQEIKEGDFFRNNLAKPPFNLPKPLSCIKTHPRHEDDETCLYEIQTQLNV